MFQTKNQSGLALRKAIANGKNDEILDIVKEKSRQDICELIQEQDTNSGKTALHLAAEMLLEHYKQKEFEFTTPSSNSVVFYSALTAYFLTFEPDLEKPDSKGITVNNLLALLPKDGLLDEKRKQFNSSDQGLELRKAVHINDIVTTRVLLLTKSSSERKIVLESKGPSSGKTAIHRACENYVAICNTKPMNFLYGTNGFFEKLIKKSESKALLQELLFCGVSLDLNIKDNNGVTVNQLLSQLSAADRPCATENKTQSVPAPI